MDEEVCHRARRPGRGAAKLRNKFKSNVSSSISRPNFNQYFMLPTLFSTHVSGPPVPRPVPPHDPVEGVGEEGEREELAKELVVVLGGLGGKWRLAGKKLGVESILSSITSDVTCGHSCTPITRLQSSSYTAQREVQLASRGLMKFYLIVFQCLVFPIIISTYLLPSCW